MRGFGCFCREENKFIWLIWPVTWMWIRVHTVHTLTGVCLFEIMRGKTLHLRERLASPGRCSDCSPTLHSSLILTHEPEMTCISQTPQSNMPILLNTYIWYFWFTEQPRLRKTTEHPNAVLHSQQLCSHWEREWMTARARRGTGISLIFITAQTCSTSGVLNIYIQWKLHWVYNRHIILTYYVFFFFFFF